MTVLDTTRKIQTDGDGIIVAFNFPFKIFSAGDLEVYVLTKSTGALALLTITTDYTVSINAITEGGTVTYVVPPSNLEAAFIVRTMAVTQPTDIPNVGNLQEEQLENEYDRSRMIDQQLQETLNRAVKVTIDRTTGPDLPSPEANKAIGWDPSAVFLVNLDSPDFTTLNPTTQTGNLIMTVTDNLILADATAGVITMTLPSVVAADGNIFRIKKIDASANAVIVDTPGAETIDGDASYSLLNRYESIMVVSDGVNWHVFA